MPVPLSSCKLLVRLGCHSRLTADFVFRGILLQNSGRLGEASLAYRAALRYRPQLAVACLNLGLATAELGSRDEAISILGRCSQLDDNGLKDPRANANARQSAVFQQARLRLEGGNAAGAVALLLKHPHNTPAALNLLGEAHQALGQLHAAELCYSRALALAPAHTPATLTLAKMLARNVSKHY